MELIQTVNNNKFILLKKIYVLKCLLSYSDNLEYIEKLNYIEKIYNSFDSSINEILSSNSKEEYNILDNDYHQVESLLNELREEVTSNCKITSVLMLDNMKKDELITFYDLLLNVLKDYQNIESASNDIFNKSFSLIKDYLNKLVYYIENNNIPNSNLLNVNLMKIRATSLEYNLNEWISTINLIKTSLKYLLNYDDQVINTLRNDFNLISVYYFIVITGGNN